MKIRRTRLLSVVALVAGLLVPATAVSAGPLLSSLTEGCDGIMYDAANPAHVLYGAGAGNVVVDGLQVVDLSGATGPQIVFWNGAHPFGASGAHIIGSDFDDTICGTHPGSGDGGDLIVGARGNDRIFGYGGPDTLLGKAGDDVLVDGSWGLYQGSGVATLKGGSGDDELHGGVGADQLFGNGGDDVLIGRSGAGQLLVGNAGADTLYGGSGAKNTLIGKGGNDLLFAGRGGLNFLFGKKGNDELTAAGTNDDLYGGPGDDSIRNMGSAAGQQAWGGSGNDTILPEFDTSVPPVNVALAFYADGNDGNDFIQGSDAADCAKYDDILLGGRDDDEIQGGAGCDDLMGNAGNDLLFGGPDDDVIEGSTGDDTLHGGAGEDRIYGDTGNDDIFGGPGADLIWGGTDTAGDGNPVDAGDDCVPGALPHPDCDKPLPDDGDDYIEGGTGEDDMDGGSGTNVLYGNSPDPIFGLDTLDAAEDYMTAWGNAIAGTSSTFFGHCTDFDRAWDNGDGPADSAYNTVNPKGIEFVVSPCDNDPYER